MSALEQLSKLVDLLRTAVGTGSVVEVRGAANDLLSQWAGLREALGAPVPMVLFCPQCLVQHVDRPHPESGWANPPHRTHECQACRHQWRPADVSTVGVATLPSTHPQGQAAVPRTGVGVRARVARLEQVVATAAELVEQWWAAPAVEGLRVQLPAGDELWRCMTVLRELLHRMDVQAVATRGREPGRDNGRGASPHPQRTQGESDQGQCLTQEELSRRLCELTGLVYHARAEYRLPCDGWCPTCTAGQGPGWRWQHEGTVVAWLLEAALEKLLVEKGTIVVNPPAWRRRELATPRQERFRLGPLDSQTAARRAVLDEHGEQVCTVVAAQADRWLAVLNSPAGRFVEAPATVQPGGGERAYGGRPDSCPRCCALPLAGQVPPGLTAAQLERWQRHADPTELTRMLQQQVSPLLPTVQAEGAFTVLQAFAGELQTAVRCLLPYATRAAAVEAHAHKWTYGLTEASTPPGVRHWRACRSCPATEHYGGPAVGWVGWPP